MKDERTYLRRRHGLNGSQLSALQVQKSNDTRCGCVLPTKWKWVVLQHHAVRARPATPTTGGMSVLAVIAAVVTCSGGFGGSSCWHTLRLCSGGFAVPRRVR